jgi:hypothetical protein
MVALQRWGAIAAVLISAWLTACSDVGCPKSFVEQEGRCVKLDSLAQLDGGGVVVGNEGSAGTVTTGGTPHSDGTAGISVQMSGDAAGQPANSGSDAGGSLSSAGYGASGAAGHAGGVSAGAAGSSGSAEPTSGAAATCDTEGALRCSARVAGGQDRCENGGWVAAQLCPSGQTCLEDATAQPRCVTVSELCRGSGGQTVCDGQGALIVCNEDESIASMMDCPSARHCQIGIPLQTCATCLPEEEHHCTQTALEQCGLDGMSFHKIEDCETAALCNAMLGKCTDAVCEPSAISCEGNALVTCNADGTAIASRKACSPGTCDSKGRDCNMCEPGTKKCDGDRVLTCDATGQTYLPSSCSDGGTCIGLGQCVECGGNDDCSEMTEVCKVGVCMGNTCRTQAVTDGTRCTAAGGREGRCSRGTCECEPQCVGKPCGRDGCGGECPNRCSGTTMCDLQLERCVCEPQCAGKVCGSDGCGGTCGNGCMPSQVGDDPPCGTATCDANGKCGSSQPVKCFRDSDNDGHGNKEISRMFCVDCRRGWVPTEDDCYDNHNGAFPGSGLYYDRDRGDGSFDYDCDGVETQQENLQPNGCSTTCAAAQPCATSLAMLQARCGYASTPTLCENLCSTTGTCSSSLGTGKVQQCR